MQQIVPFLVVCFLVQILHAEELVLLEVKQTELSRLVTRAATLDIHDDGIRVRTRKGEQWPGFNMGTRNWNLLYYGQVVVEVENLDDLPLKFHCRLDSPQFDPRTMAGTYGSVFEIGPKEKKRCVIPLHPMLPPQLKDVLFGMRGFPGGERSEQVALQEEKRRLIFQKDSVAGLAFVLNNPRRETNWIIRKVVAVPLESSQIVWMKMQPTEFFPMIDQFGQFKHETWPGKTYSIEDLKTALAVEETVLQKNPGPQDRSRYGGYTAKPKKKATGHFRIEKINGTWWFIDPDGFLFWSHGVNCVNLPSGLTPIRDRECYFENIPNQDDPLYKVCFGREHWAPHGYYRNHLPYDTFNFTIANLLRKYGQDWEKAHAELVHRRLKSWGMNTIANWSDRNIYEMRRTPYTAQFSTQGNRIEGSQGFWGKFPDPFAEGFKENVRKSAEREGKRSANDPWCLGYFVDNELSWGEDGALAIATLASPASQPAKMEFVKRLKTKYGNIDKLNATWSTEYPDWQSLLSSLELPDKRKAEEDLKAFHQAIAQEYFKTVHFALKDAAPNKLYLGCRFAWSNETAIRAAAEYCDVLSFNIYRHHLDDFSLPSGIDKPVLIGEFHFGALDRGKFHAGLVPVASQLERAKAYDRYVRSALNHALVVGTHWFQYGDQATTGRGDGENYQIGLIDVCDTPYPETIDAVQRIGKTMYDLRWNATLSSTVSDL